MHFQSQVLGTDPPTPFIIPKSDASFPAQVRNVVLQMSYSCILERGPSQYLSDHKGPGTVGQVLWARY